MGGSERTASVREPERQTPVTAEVDVLVAGGGTAGAVAAIAAARSGASTLVVEQLGFLGGTETGALVTPMMRNHLGEEPLTRGINEEILARTAAVDPPRSDSPNDRLWFSPTSLACVLDDLVSEAGARVLFGSVVAGVLKEGNTLRGVLVENKSGRSAIRAKVVLDCTGDADVAVSAGAPFEAGNAEGLNQPMSLRFSMANVDLERVRDFFTELGRPCELPLLSVGFHEGSESVIGPLVEEAQAEGVLEPGDIGYFQFFSMLGRPRELSFNCPRLAGFHGTDAWDLSRAQVVGRRKIRRIAEFCRRYLPGFEEAYVAAIAPLMGVRESRRILGEYVLTEDDVVDARKFPDAVARNCYPIDIHHPQGRGTTLRYLKPGEYHEVPYRCLVPQRVEQLLVAGRCISATFGAQAAIRIQANCRAFGHAAGVAAALALETGTTVRRIDTAELRRRLLEQGADL